MEDREILKIIYTEVKDIKQDMQEIRQELQGIKQEVQEIKQDVQEMKQDIKSLDGRMTNVESDVKNIKVVLENEIRVNIQRVAEGHLDLERKLRELVKPNSEVEMLSIQVRMLDSDVRCLKEALA